MNMYEVAILGGGPAGSAAAVYVARKKLKAVLITESFGGQSVVSDDIENWIGERHISGVELAQKLENHVRNYEDEIDIKLGERATRVEKIPCADKKRVCDFLITTNQSQYWAKTVILAVGARRRKLGVPGEDKFEGKGVSYCATCDAPLFKGKTVAVIGGGNAGLEAAVDLTAYADRIYILQRRDALKGDVETQEKLNQSGKVEVILNAEIKKVLGDQFVEGLVYLDKAAGKEKKLEVGGIFVEIGSVPNSEIVKDLVELDNWGQVKTDSKKGTTSHPGIFAAGDITDDPYKQNNISAGDGVKAALSAYAYLQKLAQRSPAAEIIESS